MGKPEKYFILFKTEIINPKYDILGGTVASCWGQVCSTPMHPCAKEARCLLMVK